METRKFKAPPPVPKHLRFDGHMKLPPLACRNCGTDLYTKEAPSAVDCPMYVCSQCCRPIVLKP
jgi:hypothetical protein